MRGFYFTDIDRVDDTIFETWLHRVPEFRRCRALERLKN